MAGGLGHQPPCYLNHQHLRLHNGRRVTEKEQGGWKKAIYSKGEAREGSSQRSCNQREKSCINHDNTFGRQPQLHQWRETASQRGEGSSQCCWIYKADVAWGVWGGRALASCVGSPAHFPWNRPWHARRTLKTVALLFYKISPLERSFRHRKAWTLLKNVKFTGPVEQWMETTWEKQFGWWDIYVLNAMLHSLLKTVLID